MRENQMIIDEDNLNNEFNRKIIDLLETIKNISPYQLLSNTLNYYKMMKTMSQKNNEYSDDNIVLKFTLEFLQMMYSLVEEKDLLVKDYNDSIFHKIMKLVEEIQTLMYRYVFMKTIDEKFKIPNEQREYIFSNFCNLIVTGKRYDVFENEHHRDVLTPLNTYFSKAYNFPIDNLYSGIAELKYKSVFGLNDSYEKLEKIINDISISNEHETHLFSPEQLNTGSEVVYDIIGLELHNVEKICGWPKEFIEIFSLSLGDNKNKQFLSISSIIDLYSQINCKPIIKLENKYYCLNPQRLLDNIDRIIIKDLYKRFPQNKQKLIKLVSDNCENITFKMFKEIIPNSKIDIHNYYKIPTGFAENDLLVEYDKNLIIVEVKSGSFTPDVAINNIESHIASLSSLIMKGDEQSNNFLDVLKEKGSIKLYEHNCLSSNVKREIYLSDYNKFYRIVITLEAFNEVESRVEKLKLINVNKDSLVICLDDLRVYKDYFESNAMEFFHYLNQRLKATRNNKLYLNDELDHLGLYIEYNDYVMFLNKQIKGYKNVGNVYFEEPRLAIDKYYNDKYFKGINGVKPTQNITNNLKEIIKFCNETFVQNGSIFICCALNLCSNSQIDIFDKAINELYKSNVLSNHYKTMYFDIGEFFMLTCLKEKDNVSLDEFDNRIYANMLLSTVEKAYAVFIYYDFNKNIKNIIIKNYDFNNSVNLDEVKEFAKTIEKTRKVLSINKIKIGRNEPCPCGSGKKYKYCCLIK